MFNKISIVIIIITVYQERWFQYDIFHCPKFENHCLIPIIIIIFLWSHHCLWNVKRKYFHSFITVTVESNTTSNICLVESFNWVPFGIGNELQVLYNLWRCLHMLYARGRERPKSRRYKRKIILLNCFLFSQKLPFKLPLIQLFGTLDNNTYHSKIDVWTVGPFAIFICFILKFSCQ